MPESAEKDSAVSLIERHRTRDFRRLFRPVAVIEELENKHSCLVQTGWRGSRAFENHVGEGMPLDRLVRSIYGRDYDGQIKVVSRDRIVQTPIVEYNPGEQANMFVRPGDLVFILGRD
jgi:hypothetical protein